MSARPSEPASQDLYYQLRDLADDFTDAADRRGERVRAEITDNRIDIVLVNPTKRHGRIVSLLVRQIEDQDERAATMAETKIEHPELGFYRTADLVVMSQDAYEASDDDAPAFAPDVDLAVEVVSKSNPENDYIKKLRDYPCMGVPCYAIVDPRDGTVSVYSPPGTIGGRPQYRDHKRFAFGDKVRMGQWLIDTAEFPRPR